MTVQYENFGDINPVEHGGLYVGKDSEAERCYYIVEFDLLPEFNDTWYLQSSYLDLDDVMDKHIKEAMSGYPEGRDMSEEEQVVEIIRYFGHTTFSSPEQKTVRGETALLRELELYGIMPKGRLTIDRIRNSQLWSLDNTSEREVFYIKDKNNTLEFDCHSGQFAFNGSLIFKKKAEKLYEEIFLPLETMAD